MTTYVPSDSGATNGSAKESINDQTQSFQAPSNNNITSSASALRTQNLQPYQQTHSSSARTNTYVADHVASQPQYEHTSSQASIQAHRERQQAWLASLETLVNK